MGYWWKQSLIVLRICKAHVPSLGMNLFSDSVLDYVNTFLHFSNSLNSGEPVLEGWAVCSTKFCEYTSMLQHWLGVNRGTLGAFECHARLVKVWYRRKCAGMMFSGVAAMLVVYWWTSGQKWVRYWYCHQICRKESMAEPITTICWSWQLDISYGGVTGCHTI